MVVIRTMSDVMNPSGGSFGRFSQNQTQAQAISDSISTHSIEELTAQILDILLTHDYKALERLVYIYNGLEKTSDQQ